MDKSIHKTNFSMDFRQLNVDLEEARPHNSTLALGGVLSPLDWTTYNQ